MGKFHKDQKGFSAVEALSVLIFVAIVAFLGLYIAHNRNGKTVTPTATVKSSTSAKTTTTSDSTANWKTYTSAAGKFTVKYPETWTLNECSGDVLLGATSAEAGDCQGSSTAQIQISSMSGDERQNWQLKSGPVYLDLATSTVIVNGNESIKQTATFSPGSNSTTGGIPDGTKVTNYIFYTNGQSYLFTYNQKPTGTDISTDANLIVTKALTFNQ